MIRSITLSLCAALSICTPLAASGVFTAEQPNAVPSGMGGAYTAADGEISSIDYNPAGLAGIGELKLMFSYRDYHSLNLLGHSYAGFAAPISRDAALAVSVSRIGTTGNVSFMDYSEETYSLGVGGRLALAEGLRGGAVLTFYRVVSDENASGYGVSAGVLWSPPSFNNLNIGVSARNINSPLVTWTSGAEDRLDASFAVGASYRHNSGVSGALSYEDTLKAAIEYDLPGDLFSLRAGYRGLENFNGAVSAGFSASYGFFRLDYAAEHHGALGLSHFFTVNVFVERI